MMYALEREFVFLSYAKEDFEQVCNIYDGLKKRGLNVWFDKEKKRPGRWKKRIEKAISKSRYFIFCVSQASLKKTGDENPGFVDYELQIAW